MQVGLLSLFTRMNIREVVTIRPVLTGKTHPSFSTSHAIIILPLEPCHSCNNASGLFIIIWGIRPIAMYFTCWSI